MIFALILLIPLLILALWVYIKKSPKELNRSQVRVFDLSVFFIAVLLSLAFILKTYSKLSSGPDRAWWPILSILGSMGIITLCLVVGALIRYAVFQYISKRRKS